MSRPAVTLYVLLSVLVLVHSLSLGGRGEDEAEELHAMEKRHGRRMTRDRYRMGYMFGKRSGLDTASLLIKALAGKALPVDSLVTALHNDPAIARQVAAHLDRNHDGYVAVSELL